MIPDWRERIDDPTSVTTVFDAMKAEIDDLRAALATIERETVEWKPWEPHLRDRADGVKGHFCIARYNPSGYHEFLNKGKWCSAGEVIIPPDHRKHEIRALTKEG